MNVKQMNVKQQIRSYVAESLFFSSDDYDLDDDMSFLDEGVVDSTGVVELVLFVEENFDIEVDDDEIVPDNFDSVNNLVAYIERKLL
jgi:acyl carrier protein